MLDQIAQFARRLSRGVEAHDDRVVPIVIGDVGEDLTLVRDLRADVAPDHFYRRFDRAQPVRQLFKVRAPGLPWDLVRGDCHHLTCYGAGMP